MIQDYIKAKKLGEREYRRKVVKGQYPYLPALEEMVSDIDRLPEIDLGFAEIPMDMIVGTRTRGRQNAFAPDFMPLMAEDTEFAAKWSSLFDAQVSEGIREPVKVYEFMNHFYVGEGNKRVSVMRYVGAVSIFANVIRIRPPASDSVQSRIYYEYLDFYKVTRSFEITFSAPGRYEKLARILEQNLHDPWPDELLRKLHSGLIAFKRVYIARGGLKLNLTMGDALLIYLSVYSLDSLLREGRAVIGRRLMSLRREYVAAAQPRGIALIENREDAAAAEKKTTLSRMADLVGRTNAAGVTGAADLAGAVAGITGGAEAAVKTRKVVKSSLEAVIPVASGAAGYSPANPLKIAFIHEKSSETSGWVYGHMLGANHLKEAFGSLVETMHFDHCRDKEEILNAFETARAEGCGVVFTTSSSLARPALRFAVENPGVKVLNCSVNQTPHALRFYYGKMYEAKFLLGALAASMTDDHRISYTAGKKDIMAFASVNAFALGAQLTDPGCRVRLRWLGEDCRDGTNPECRTRLAEERREETAPECLPRLAEERREETAPECLPRFGEDCRDGTNPECRTRFGKDCRERAAAEKYRKSGIHVFSDIDMIRPDEERRRYGVFSVDESSKMKRLAASIWNWGMFYELIVRRILDGTYDSEPASRRDRALNYWMGLSSGIIEVVLSDELPRPACRLAELLRQGIVDGRISPFEGVIYDRDGKAHGTAGTPFTAEQIMEMDWLAGNIDLDE